MPFSDYEHFTELWFNAHRLIAQANNILLGDNVANVTLWVEAFAAAAVTRRVRWIAIDVQNSIAIANQFVFVGTGAAGAEVELFRAGIQAGANVVNNVSMPILIEANTRIALRAGLSDGDGIADGELLEAWCRIYG